MPGDVLGLSAIGKRQDDGRARAARIRAFRDVDRGGSVKIGGLISSRPAEAASRSRGNLISYVPQDRYRAQPIDPSGTANAGGP